MTTAAIEKPADIVSREAMARRVIEACSKGAQPFVGVCSTVPKMRQKMQDDKTNINPFWEAIKDGRFRKVSLIGGMVIANWDYEKSVNAQRTREGKTADFVKSKPSWSPRQIPGSPFGLHTRKGDEEPTMYMIIKIQKSIESVFILDGKPLSDADTKIAWQFFVKSDARAHQGVETEILYRPYIWTNVLRLHIAKQVLEVIDANLSYVSVEVPNDMRLSEMLRLHIASQKNNVNAEDVQRYTEMINEEKFIVVSSEVRQPTTTTTE